VEEGEVLRVVVWIASTGWRWVLAVITPRTIARNGCIFCSCHNKPHCCC